MLRRRYLAVLAVSVIGSIPVYACGGDSDSGGGGGSGTGGTGTGGTGTGGTGGGNPDPVEDGKRPPQSAGGSTGTGTEATVVALDTLLLGDTDPTTGQPDSSAWRRIGYNLDGIISTKTGSNHCKPQEGANPASVKTDGDQGIDNSFGSNLMPIIGTLTSNPSQQISESLTGGDFTIILGLDNLDANADQTAIDGALYGGAKFDALVDCTATPNDPNCSAPKFDGSDAWPVLPELLTNPADINSSKVKFPSSYVSGGTWVSGTEGTLDLTISISGYTLALKITKAVLTMKVNGTGSTATATDGIIAGVIPTEQLVAELKKVAGSFDTNLCDGATFESIAQQIRAASDIMSDGTNGDATKTCDGISVGLGFTAKGISLGGIAPTAEPPPDPCAGDGGA